MSDSTFIAIMIPLLITLMFLGMSVHGFYLFGNIARTYRHWCWDLFKILFAYPHLQIFDNNKYDCCIITYNVVLKLPISITIKSTYSKPHAVSSLLHEIGHYEAICVDKVLHQTYKKVKIVGQFFPDIVMSKNKQQIIKDEKLAWKKAIQIAKKLNIKIDKKHAIMCIKSYGGKSAHLQNLED